MKDRLWSKVYAQKIPGQNTILRLITIFLQWSITVPWVWKSGGNCDDFNMPTVASFNSDLV